jgi:hypothetical protein
MTIIRTILSSSLIQVIESARIIGSPLPMPCVAGIRKPANATIRKIAAVRAHPEKRGEELDTLQLRLLFRSNSLNFTKTDTEFFMTPPT